MKIAFIYEHPDWSKSLINSFAENGIQLQLVNVADLAFDTQASSINFDLAINRVNIMPSAGRASPLVAHTLHYLGFLEQSGVRVVNGYRAHFAGASKAIQNGIFSNLGLDCPRAIAVYQPEDILQGASDIGFPVMLKPNIGGSGAGIVRYNNEQELSLAVQHRLIDLGVDRSGLVQQYIESDGSIYRIEVLGDQLFYGIKQRITEGSYNYCAADGCSVTDPDPSPEDADASDGIQVFHPEPEIVDVVAKIISTAGADLGGVEYFINTRTSRPCFYDFNPYSNFVSNGENLLGFSPEQRYVEYIRDLIGI